MKEPYEDENKSNKKKPFIIELVDDNDRCNEKNESVTHINEQDDSKTNCDEQKTQDSTTTFDNFNKLNTEFDSLD